MTFRVRVDLRVALACVTLLAAGSLARAADKPATADKSAYTLFDPVPDALLRDFTPDRPTKATTPITVDAGRFQIESDFLNYSASHGSGLSSRTFEVADPVLKLGLTNFAEFDVAVPGYTDTRVRQDGAVTRGTGFGDVTLSSKINLLGNDGGPVAFAIEPYLVVPSGVRNLSAGQVQGGLIAPLQVKLPADFTGILQTEVDALANTNSPGTHVAFTNILNLSHDIPGIKGLTGIVEFYSQLDTERHTDDSYSFDAALAYLVADDTQLDVGTNIGLSRGLPDYQVYSGIAHRF